MKEKTKRKLVGSWLYSIYRRTRYIRYLKKLKKEKRKQARLEKIREQKEFKQNIRRQNKINRKLDRQKKKQEKLERKQSKLELRKTLAEQNKGVKILNKLKQEQENTEEEILLVDIKKSFKEQNRIERRLEKKKRKQEKEERKKEQQEVKKRLREKIRADKKILAEQRRKQIEFEIAKSKQKRKLRPYLIRRRMREIWHGVRSIDKYTIKRWIAWINDVRNNPKERINFIKIVFNSTILFVFAYLTLYIIGQGITVWVSTTFEYETIFYYYKIYYNIKSHEWSADSVKILYSITPLTGLIFGTIALILFSQFKNSAGVFKTYFLWCFVCGLVMFFGSTLMGTLLNQGFGWVIAYLYYKDTGKMIFSIISIFALVTVGTSIARSFLISGNAYFNNITDSNRKTLLLSHVVIPSILGTAILCYLKIPPEYYFTTEEEVIFEILKLSTVFIIIVSIVFSFTSFTELFFDEEPRKVRFKWLYLIVLVIVYFAFYTIFYDGVQIGAAQM